TRERATENAIKAQKKMRKWYSRKARKRTFEPGMKVLAILPKKKEPFEYKWTGPHTVISRVGNVNYWIKTQSKRKPQKLIHVNLLKKYHERDELLNMNTGTTLLTLYDKQEESENTDIFRIPELHLKDSKATEFDLNNIPVKNREKLY